tara:strand:+ start:30402 stop:30695 length:294 start_codon:yes stop_codon:yes gene_type:complete
MIFYFVSKSIHDNVICFICIKYDITNDDSFEYFNINLNKLKKFIIKNELYNKYQYLLDIRLIKETEFVDDLNAYSIFISNTGYFNETLDIFTINTKT